MKIYLTLLLFFICLVSNAQVRYRSVEDSLKVKRILDCGEFRSSIDEFTGEITIYHGKEPGMKHNTCYFYLTLKNGVVSAFMVPQVYGSDWLFMRQILIKIDDKVYQRKLENVKKEVGDGFTYEWSHEYVKDASFQAFANATEVKIRFIGDTYYRDYVVSKKRMESIKKLYELYSALKNAFTINE